MNPAALSGRPMRSLLQNAYMLATTFGVDPRRTLRALRDLPDYFRDRDELKRQMTAAGSVPFPFAKSYPCLGERSESGGTASGAYFHQDLLVARRIHANAPGRHVDVGSRVDGFVAHVASYRAIEVIDIRPLANTIPNVSFTVADFMKPLPSHLEGYCDSASSLHTMEHFGLGRYGDPVTVDGYLRGIENLHLLLKPGGKLYFSVPMGPQRVEFNAHRVFSAAFLLDLFKERYRVDRFSYVDDAGNLHEDIPLEEKSIRGNFGCYYGCGILEMTKL